MRRIKLNILCAALAALFLAPAVVRGAVLTARPGGAGAISAVVDSAAPGDTVVIEDGDYSENIVIRNPVTLTSKNGRERVVIRPAVPSAPVILIDGVATGKVAVTGLTLTGATGTALYARASTGVNIYSNAVHGNDTGVYFDHVGGGRIEGNIVKDNAKGIYLYFSDGNVITKNNADNNFNNGILLHASHGNEIIENSAVDNYWNGITLSASNNNLVARNRAIKNTYAIVASESTGNTITDNGTMRRLYLLLPIALLYCSIMLYLVEKKLFVAYYNYKYRERGRMQGVR